jgi:hypothetical protein
MYQCTLGDAMEGVDEGGLDHFELRRNGARPLFGGVEVEALSGHCVLAGSKEEGGLCPVSRIGAVEESSIKVEEGQGGMGGAGFKVS